MITMVTLIIMVTLIMMIMVTLMQLLLKLKHLPPRHALPLFLIGRLAEVSQNLDQSFLI